MSIDEPLDGGMAGEEVAGGTMMAELDRNGIIDALMRLVAERGWRNLSLAAVAEEAGLPLLRVYRLFGSKQAILVGLYRRVDEAVLANPPEPEPDERPRDRLFDLLMRRFDALAPYKPTLEVLSREIPRDPAAALCAGSGLLRSMGWMLEGAGVAAVGLRRVVATKLLTGVYLATMRVWLRDDTVDLARTMSTLDSRLRRIERWLGADMGWRVRAARYP